MSESNKTYSAAQTVYAKALLELATEKGCLADVVDEMAQISQLLAADAGLKALCDSKVLSVESRGESLKKIFKGQVSDVTLDFMGVVNQKDRLAELSEICGAFAKVSGESLGHIDVDVYVAQALDGGALSGLASGIGGALGKTANLNMIVEPSLIGGLKLRIGDQLIDGSVASQLKGMKQRLIDAGREKAKLAASSN